MKLRDRCLGAVVFFVLMVGCEVATVLDASAFMLILGLFPALFVVGLFRVKSLADDRGIDRTVMAMDTFAGGAILATITFVPVSILVDRLKPIKFDMASGYAGAFLVGLVYLGVFSDIIARIIAHFVAKRTA